LHAVKFYDIPKNILKIKSGDSSENKTLFIVSNFNSQLDLRSVCPTHGFPHWLVLSRVSV